MKHGDIVQLGRHRLMCGDATKYEDIEQLLGGDRVNLVLTDPPYGIKLLGNGTTGRIGGKTGREYPTVIGDMNTDMAKEHYRIVRTISNRMIIWGGQNFTRILPPSCGWIFWDKEKNSDALSFGDGELAWTNVSTRIRKYSFKSNGFITAGDKTLNQRVHPTQKPVELHMQILEDFTQPDDVILDCFGGSGTTLIACQLTGRTCYMMEISPEYCDIITNRYKTLTEGLIPFAEG